MQRREFITLLGGAAASSVSCSASWPVSARAQQRAAPVIGFLNGTSPDPFLGRVAAFRKGLSEIGYVEIKNNVSIQYRWAENQTSQLPKFAADLVRRKVAVIATTGGTAAALAAKRATTTIPIVFEIGGDPITSGLVDKLDRPGSNVTGISLNAVAFGPKQLDLVRELKPGASIVGVLVNANNPNPVAQSRMEAAARALGMQIAFLNIVTEADFDAAFKKLSGQHADALLVSNDSYFINWHDEIIELATRYTIPTIYTFRGYAAAGGLMSYGRSITDVYHQVGDYAGRILKGEKPADLPVLLASKFELVINLTTARTLGLSLPPGLLARAEVIE